MIVDVAMNVPIALGTSMLAFIVGVLLGISLGYIIWADSQDRKE